MPSDQHPPVAGHTGDGDPATPLPGTLVISTWHEPQGFRARLTFSTDPDGEPRTLYSADAAEVLRTVGQWLAGQATARGDT